MSNDNTNTDDNGEESARDWNPMNLPARIDNSGDDSDDGDDALDLPVSLQTLAIGLSALFALLVGVTVLVLAPFMWTVAIIATIIGFIPGLTLFPWVTSPFGPGLWMLSTPFARIHLTISQVIRKAGVLVKRRTNEYEHATYLPKENAALCADGTKVPVDDDRANWGLFGKRRLGLTWEEGTDLHRRIRADSDGNAGNTAATDGGEEQPEVNMAAAHRYFEGVNNADVITRTEEKAEAQFGGGEELGSMTMGILVGLMLLLGSFTAMLML